MISISVAVDPNGGIGCRGVMPWHIREELRIFRRNTMFKNIVMGRTTYENLPGKLKDRYMTIVSSDPEYDREGVTVVHDLIAFLEEHRDDDTEYVICGGSSVYSQSYPYAKKAYISFIRKEYEADAYFDVYDPGDWVVAAEEEHEEFIYRELHRKESRL